MDEIILHQQEQLRGLKPTQNQEKEKLLDEVAELRNARNWFQSFAEENMGIATRWKAMQEQFGISEPVRDTEPEAIDAEKTTATKEKIAQADANGMNIDEGTLTPLRDDTASQEFYMDVTKQQIEEFFKPSGKYYYSFLGLIMRDQIKEAERGGTTLAEADALQRARKYLEKNLYAKLKDSDSAKFMAVIGKDSAGKFQLRGVLSFISAADMYEHAWKHDLSLLSRHLVGSEDSAIDPQFAQQKLQKTDMFGLDLVVDPTVRGRGIGTALYVRALQSLKDEGVQIVRGTTLSTSKLLQKEVIGAEILLGKEMDGWIPGTKVRSYAVLLNKVSDVSAQADAEKWWEKRLELNENDKITLRNFILDVLAIYPSRSRFSDDFWGKEKYFKTIMTHFVLRGGDSHRNFVRAFEKGATEYFNDDNDLIPDASEPDQEDDVKKDSSLPHLGLSGFTYEWNRALKSNALAAFREYGLSQNEDGTFVYPQAAKYIMDHFAIDDQDHKMNELVNPEKLEHYRKNGKGIAKIAQPVSVDDLRQLTNLSYEASITRPVAGGQLFMSFSGADTHTIEGVGNEVTMMLHPSFAFSDPVELDGLYTANYKEKWCQLYRGPKFTARSCATKNIGAGRFNSRDENVLQSREEGSSHSGSENVR